MTKKKIDRNTPICFCVGGENRIKKGCKTVGCFVMYGWAPMDHRAKNGAAKLMTGRVIYCGPPSDFMTLPYARISVTKAHMAKLFDPRTRNFYFCCPLGTFCVFQAFKPQRKIDSLLFPFEPSSKRQVFSVFLNARVNTMELSIERIYCSREKVELG